MEAPRIVPCRRCEAQVIHERHRGRQFELIVRGLDESGLEQLRFAAGVVAVESRTPRWKKSSSPT